MFSVDEAKVRNNWLSALYVYFFSDIALVILCYLFFMSLGESEAAQEYVTDMPRDSLRLFISLAIMYYFAYVKLGTKWIGFFLLASPIGLLGIAALSWKETFGSEDLSDLGIYFILFLSLYTLSFFAYFWIHSRRLYEVNKAIKQKKKEGE